MIGVAIAVLAVPVFGVYCYKRAYKRPENFPPGPPSLPIYGAYWILLATAYNDLATAVSRLAKRYQTKILGMYLGPFTAIVVNDPVLLKEMLNREEFDGRVDFIVARLRSYWKKLGIFFTDGYFWHIQRRFSLRYMRDFGFGRRDPILEDVVANEIKEMVDMRVSGPSNTYENELVKGELVQMPHFFAVPFINGIVHVFSRTTVPRSEYKELWDMAKHGLRFQRGTNDLGGALTITTWLKDVLPKFSGFKDLVEGNQYFLKFYSNIVKDTLESHDRKYDRHFLDMYIKKLKEETEECGRSTFSVDQLTLICTDYTFPAATCVEQVLSMLVEKILMQPEIQDKIHEEIDRVVGRDRLPNLDDRSNMPYTEACIRETMRYDTLVPLGVPHRSVSDAQLGGYIIPENTMVAANYVSLHMDKEIWGDPENFRPERFIVDGKLKVALDKSLPFGAGKRLCAGETYSRQTLFQVFSGFMQAFSVSTADGKPLTKPFPRIQGIITTLPEYWVRVMPRT